MAGAAMTGGAIDIAAVKAAHRIEDIVRDYGVDLKRAGRELVGLSPFKRERTPSFYVDPRKQVFKDFASGEGGDVICFVQLAYGYDFREALEQLAAKAGIQDTAHAAELAERRRKEQARADAGERAEKQRHIRWALKIWAACVPAGGTLAERYLRARGIDLDAIGAVYGYKIPKCLRFHPDLEYRHAGVEHRGPAMVGAIHDAGRVFTGCHRTWLAPSGEGKADVPKPKLTLGVVWGSLGYLSRPDAMAVVGEGYETTLSVMAEMARDGECAFFASGLSLGNITGGGLQAIPARDKLGALMPGCVKRLTLLGDNDGKDPDRTRAMLNNGAIKFRQLQGIETRIAMADPGCDFNDMVRGRRVA